MKLSLIFIFFTACSYSQVKRDTLFTGAYSATLNDSKIDLIIANLQNLCEKPVYKPNRKLLENNREFVTMGNLRSFNDISKSKIFTAYDVAVVAYFCENVDFEYNMELFEFHYADAILAEKCLAELKALSKHKTFMEGIATKNWYFASSKNIVYFLRAGLKDELNPMKIAIEKEIRSSIAK